MMSLVGSARSRRWALVSLVGESVHRGWGWRWASMRFVQESNLNHVLGAALFRHRPGRFGSRGLVDVDAAELTLSLFQLTVFIGLNLIERLIVTL